MATNLYAALNIASGHVITDLTPRHRAREFRRFLDLIDAQVPDELAVHVVLDNVATHRTAEIQPWLQRHRRFTFHFTPTYSSWMTLVERWFAELTTKWLRRGTHRSVADLNDANRTPNMPLTQRPQTTTHRRSATATAQSARNELQCPPSRALLVAKKAPVPIPLMPLITYQLPLLFLAAVTRPRDSRRP